MIHIDKGAIVPRILLSGRGIKETTKLCEDFDLNPYDYLGASPQLKHKFHSSIYASKSVKSRLRICQHNKCCFSEAKFAGDYGDVEHFRPKGRVNIGESKKVNYPGYYWLAYSWDNLFLCKQIINQSHKKNLFPLRNETNRAKNHNDEVDSEKYLLIDPSRDDPRKHIRFHRDEPVGKTARGKKTILLLNLRHPHFEEGRRKLIDSLEKLNNALTELEREGLADSEAAINIRDCLNESVQPCAEYSSMAMDFLSEA